MRITLVRKIKAATRSTGTDSTSSRCHLPVRARTRVAASRADETAKSGLWRKCTKIEDRDGREWRDPSSYVYARAIKVRKLAPTQVFETQKSHRCQSKGYHI